MSKLEIWIAWLALKKEWALFEEEVGIRGGEGGGAETCWA